MCNASSLVFNIIYLFVKRSMDILQSLQLSAGDNDSYCKLPVLGKQQSLGKQLCRLPLSGHRHPHRGHRSCWALRRTRGLDPSCSSCWYDRWLLCRVPKCGVGQKCQNLWGTRVLHLLTRYFYVLICCWNMLKHHGIAWHRMAQSPRHRLPLSAFRQRLRANQRHGIRRIRRFGCREGHHRRSPGGFCSSGPWRAEEGAGGEGPPWNLGVFL